MQKSIDILLKRILPAIFFFTVLAISPARADQYEDATNSARLGDTRQLVRLINGGVSVDSADMQGNTLLLLASMEGHVDTVQALLKFKPNLSLSNVAGDSPLMMATLKGQAKIVDILLAAGAPIDGEEGWTPLLYAAYEGQLAILDKLLLKGANVNALSPNQSNALMFAARNGHIHIVRRLLETDINIDQANDRGFTAETWANANGNTDIAAIILAERKKRALSDRAITIEFE